MSHTAFVYHDNYDLQFGEHVFPTVKYKLVRQTLMDRGILDPAELHAPEPASDEDIALVHSQQWIRKLKFGTLTYDDVMRLEIPYSQQVVRAFWLAAGGTILAARLSLKHGIGFNIGGGFHHAFPDHGEGFCAIHDVAIAARRLQQDGLAVKVMIIDTDVHQGNGTAAIFAHDPNVFTLSIHQRNNYPEFKPPSTIDIHMEDNAGDGEYLRRLSESCRLAIPGFKPDILFYVAGADPFCHDQLGGLNLTFDGLRERDRIVFELACRERIPVVVTLAGGYAFDLNDTVRIHASTAEIGELTWKEMGNWGKSRLT